MCNTTFYHHFIISIAIVKYLFLQFKDSFNFSNAGLSGFHQEPRDVTAYLHQKAYFACHVYGSPPPKIRWLKDERPLQIDELRMTILPSGALEIDEVSEDINMIFFKTH